MPIPAVYWNGSIMVTTAKGVMPWRTRSWPVSATRATESHISLTYHTSLLCANQMPQLVPVSDLHPPSVGLLCPRRAGWMPIIGDSTIARAFQRFGTLDAQESVGYLSLTTRLNLG